VILAILAQTMLLSGSDGDLAPSLDGNGKFFSRTKISDWLLFGKKFPFSRQKFLMTFF